MLDKTLKSFRNIAVSIVLFYLTACASLTVSVEVLNADSIKVRSAMPSILAETPISISEEVDSYERLHEEIYLTYIAKKKDDIQNGLFNQAEAELIEDYIDATYDAYYDVIKPRYENYRIEWISLNGRIKDTYQKYENEKNTAKRNAYLQSTYTAIQARDKLIKKILEFREFDLQKKVSEAPHINEVIKSKETMIERTNIRLFDSGGIDNSPLLYQVVNSPNKDWAKYFDKSFGHGYFGNTDIAIKAMDEPGNFTVKGLSFNPSDVASVASKVVSQGVVIAAQIAGVPVNIGSTANGNGAALADASKAVNTHQSAIASQNAAVQNQRAALLKLAQVILDEKDKIKGSVSEKQSAVAAIKAVYQSQKFRIDVPTEPTTENE